MKYYSTRDKKHSKPFSFSQCLLSSLAPDGGLYVPEKLPQLDLEALVGGGRLVPYPKLAYNVLLPFVEEDISEAELEYICDNAFNFPIELKDYEGIPSTAFLELFLGPTMAFKDFGARFLAYTMQTLLKKTGEKKTILVATSGDTGSAVASAFEGRENINVKVLFPKGMVSARQRAQLCSFGSNIETFEVDGTFDDCQRMVKEAFADASLAQEHHLSSANSINIGRLLPQAVYYVYASLKYYLRHGREALVIVPTGNAGNVQACYYAKAMGAKIRKVFLSLNANHSIVDYLNSGEFTGHKTIATYANAMDVGKPSNMERLMDMFRDFDEFKANVSARSVENDKIAEGIREFYSKTGKFICPHTACAFYAREHWLADERDAIVVCTADYSKFSDVLSKILGIKIEESEYFRELLRREARPREISVNYKSLFS